MASIDKSRRSARDLSSLDAMEEEISYQTEDLPLLSAELQNQENRRHDLSKLVFTGSGDSYASSLFAHYLSGGVTTVADPYELSSLPRLSRNKTVFITSITGRTNANTQLARRLGSIARLRVAVTADPNSKLAQECDETILLRYRTRGKLTSGTISFTSSLVALASQVQRLPRLIRLDTDMRHAARWAETVRMRRERRFVFVGSGTGYALAAYGAFKIHEVLGFSADYQHTEQLGHSQLFSLDKSDTIICVAIGYDGKTVALHGALRRSGFGSYLLRVNNRNSIASVLEASFALQRLALTIARRRGQTECAFLADRSRLNLSSRLIY